MDYAALIAQLVGTVGGAAASQMSNDQALALIKSVSDAYGQINVPALQKLVAQQQAPSQLAGIKDDAGYRAEQQQADAQLNDVVNSGGLTLGDRAALNDIQQRSARTASMGRNAITDAAAARGGMDSGSTLAAELANQQNSADTINRQGEQTAGNAQARAYAAIQQRGQNAAAGLNRTNQMAEDKARAQDAINAGNTAIANAAQKYNAGLPQQDFQNQLDLANGKAGATYKTASQVAANGQNTQKNMQGVGNVAAAGLNQAGKKDNTGGGEPNGGTPPPYGGVGSSSGMSDPNAWNYYPSSGTTPEPGTSSFDGGTSGAGNSSDALSSPGTRPAGQKEIVGYDENGKPLYGYRSAS